MKRCNAKHPTLLYETGQPVRCDERRQHDGRDHFASFAMRSWEVSAEEYRQWASRRNRWGR